MRKFISTAMALALAATGAVVVIPPTPAEAQCAPRHVGGSTKCSSRDRRHYSRHYDRDYRHRHYHRRHYYRDYYDDDDDFGAAAAAGIFGLAIGAMAGAAAGGSSYDARCAAKYRSYDPRSNTYMGYDGVRHRCRL